MTNSTSQCSTSRMKPTRPAGTFASTYTRVCSVSLSACGPSSDARVPMLRRLPVPFQIRHRLCLLVRLRVRARRVFRLGTQLRDERVALVNQLLPLTAAISGANGVLAEERERDRRIAIRDDRIRQHARIDLSPAD